MLKNLVVTLIEGPALDDAVDQVIRNVEGEREGVDVPGRRVDDGVRQLGDARLLAVFRVHQSRPQLA